MCVFEGVSFCWGWGLVRNHSQILFRELKMAPKRGHASSCLCAIVCASWSFLVAAGCRNGLASMISSRRDLSLRGGGEERCIISYEAEWKADPKLSFRIWKTTMLVHARTYLRAFLVAMRMFERHMGTVAWPSSLQVWSKLMRPGAHKAWMKGKWIPSFALTKKNIVQSNRVCGIASTSPSAWRR